MKLSGAILALALAACPLGACSCMLLFQGTSEEVTVTSDPPGATVTLNNGETRVTPFTITVPRNQDLQLHFSKAGYQSADLVDGTQLEGLTMVDVIPLMLPWAVDVSAGAGFAHQQTALNAHLDPVAGAGGDAQSISDAPSPARSKAAASDTQIAP